MATDNNQTTNAAAASIADLQAAQKLMGELEAFAARIAKLKRQLPVISDFAERIEAIENVAGDLADAITAVETLSARLMSLKTLSTRMWPWIGASPQSTKRLKTPTP